MKTHILTLFLISFAATCVMAQKSETPNLPIDDLTQRITYTDVVQVDSSASMLELYSIGREWFAKTYKSSVDVIQMEDKESGKIVGKASMQVYHKALGTYYPSGYINYTVSLYFRDGRFKYEITNFQHSDHGPCEEMIKTTKKTMGMSYQKYFDYYLIQMDENIINLIDDLKVTMKTKKGDDW